MQPKAKQRLMELEEQLAVEQNPDTFLKLIRERNQLLEKNKQLLQPTGKGADMTERNEEGSSPALQKRAG